jgi:hypothetical protein
VLDRLHFDELLGPLKEIMALRQQGGQVQPQPTQQAHQPKQQTQSSGEQQQLSCFEDCRRCYTRDELVLLRPLDDTLYGGADSNSGSGGNSKSKSNSKANSGSFGRVQVRLAVLRESECDAPKGLEEGVVCVVKQERQDKAQPMVVLSDYMSTKRTDSWSKKTLVEEEVVLPLSNAALLEERRLLQLVCAASDSGHSQSNASKCPFIVRLLGTVAMDTGLDENDDEEEEEDGKDDEDEAGGSNGSSALEDEKRSDFIERSEFIVAAQDGNLESVRAYVKKLETLNKGNSKRKNVIVNHGHSHHSGLNALHAAVIGQQHQVVQILLEHGASVHSMTPTGSAAATATAAACRHSCCHYHVVI